MRLKALVLKNFRCYREEVKITFEPDLTVFIGRNDIGKSSILDALGIFFDSPLIKFEVTDLSTYATEQEVRIGCIFEDLPETLTLDATSTTNLNDEYLLNEDNNLEVHKVFDCSLKTIKPRIVARAFHPSTEGYHDLLQLKNSELKARLREKNVSTDEVDLRSNPSIRRALWTSCDNLQRRLIEIELNKEDAKKIWTQIQQYLPIFALFKADRSSTDEDSEVQDPMKLAIRQAVSELTQEFQQIQDRIREEALNVANRTLDKLKELDPNLARELSPTFRSDPKWESLFKLTLTTEDQIPVNKRGSGVRRLILLGFFRAEAERRQQEEGRQNIIYAIEEPETSQHPHNQRAIIEALKDLAFADKSQVLITTHVPGLAEMIPIDALRYVRFGNENIRIIEAGSDEVFRRIADDLGVIPDNRVRVFVCVEGPNDIAFLKNIAQILWKAGENWAFDPDQPEIVFLPLGGSTLKDWVNDHYLKTLGRPEIHIYDKGGESPPKYQRQADEVNNRNDDSMAFLTEKAEMENYLHPEAIRKVLQIDVEVEDDTDIPEIVARKIHEQDGGATPWDELTEDKRKKKKNQVKRRLNSEVAAQMTIDMLKERNALDEIRRWFEAIKNHCL